MSDAKSFIEVLEEQLRADLRKEIEADVMQKLEFEGWEKKSVPPSNTSAAHRFESWVLSQVANPFGESRSNRSAKAQAAYGAPQKTRHVQNVVPLRIAIDSEPRVCAVTTEQLCAVEFLRRHSGIPFNDSFTEDELKQVWRKAALKTHPDRFATADEKTKMRMNALFRELAEASELLHALFTNKKAA